MQKKAKRKPTKRTSRPKKPTGINFIRQLDIYPCTVMFSFGETDDKLLESLKEYGWEGGDEYSFPDEYAVGRACWWAGGLMLVRLRHMPDCPTALSMLSHEVFHVVDYITRHVGIRLVEGSSEAYTYLTQYLMEEVYKILFDFKVLKS